MKTCFIVQKFGKEGSKERKRADVVMRMILAVLKELHYEATRSDDIRQSGQIVPQVLEKLHDADLVIVDLAGASPNVYYELAVRHSFEKSAICLIDDPEK